MWILENNMTTRLAFDWREKYCPSEDLVQNTIPDVANVEFTFAFMLMLTTTTTESIGKLGLPTLKLALTWKSIPSQHESQLLNLFNLL